MIDKKVLRVLIGQKLKDADVLVANSRYSSAVYLAGYALEWNLVVTRNPEMRYKIQKFLKKDTLENIAAIRILIQNIL